MDDKSLDTEFSSWFSSYGVITSQRILERYQVKIPQKELLVAIKNPVSFYHQLILVPLKNVLNGIVFQQANDYHVYTQKLYIDYLLSGESSKTPEEQGAATRDDIEEERKALVIFGELFAKKLLEHEYLISVIQNGLIKLTSEFKRQFDSSVKSIDKLLTLSGIEAAKKTIQDSVVHALIYNGITVTMNEDSKMLFVDKMNEKLKISMTNELKQKFVEHFNGLFDTAQSVRQQIEEYSINVKDMGNEARFYRSEFYNKALTVVELLSRLSDYRIDQEQDLVNRESLYFDKSIGG
jgi:hypothetical protein